MDALDGYRKEIDKIDEEITALFERRMNVVLDVAKYKKENNLKIFHKGREDAVIKKNVERLKNKDYEVEIEKFYNYLMEVSRELQKRKMEDSKSVLDIKEKNIDKKDKVGFQGVKGSFGEEALLKYFGDNYVGTPYEEFEDVFNGIKEEEIKYGILPVENSSTGGIPEVHDLLIKYDFYIVGELIININQCLMSLNGATIEGIDEVYSHPQGFTQSSEFLKKYDHFKKIPFHNTAISAKLVADLKDKTKAAIASKRAAEIYDLNILAKNINNEKNNATRFIIVSKEILKEKDANKISIVFSLEDKPGTLFRLLKSFSENNLNMLRIESRPAKDKKWKYNLYIDFEGNLEDKSTIKALDLINTSSEYFKLLGWYKNGIN